MGRKYKFFCCILLVHIVHNSLCSPKSGQDELLRCLPFLLDVSSWVIKDLIRDNIELLDTWLGSLIFDTIWNDTVDYIVSLARIYVHNVARSCQRRLHKNRDLKTYHILPGKLTGELSVAVALSPRSSTTGKSENS